jgi:hypothetical protein
VTDAVMVYTAAGTPSLALKDGGVATYNAAQSDPAGLLLVFDYTVGAADATPDLGLTTVGMNGAVITAAGGQALNFSGTENMALGVQVGSPLTVSSVALSATGEADTGKAVNITLQMNSPVTVDLGTTLAGYRSPATVFGLALNDGAIAIYSQALSSPSSGELVFTDTVAAADHGNELSITGILGLTPAPYSPLS